MQEIFLFAYPNTERVCGGAISVRRIQDKKYGIHSVSPDGSSNWYPQACRFLKRSHHIRPSFEKSIIERTIQYKR